MSGVEGEDLVEADEAQDAQGVGGNGGERDVRLGGVGVAADSDQCGDAAGVAEGQAGEVQDQALAGPERERAEQFR